MHVGPDECGVGETEKFLVGRHRGRSGTTAVQPRRGVENQTLRERRKGIESGTSGRGLLGREKFAGSAIVVRAVDGECHVAKLGSDSGIREAWGLGAREHGLGDAPGVLELSPIASLGRH